jgi:hypothetical protein
MSSNSKIQKVNTYCSLGYMLSYKSGYTDVTEIRCLHCSKLLCTPVKEIAGGYHEEHDMSCCDNDECQVKIEELASKDEEDEVEKKE